MKPTLVFSDPSAERVAALKRGFGAEPGLEVIQLKSDELYKLRELDAIFLTIMAAETLGAVPSVHKAQVLPNRGNRLPNWPAYVVAGVAMAKNDPREPIFELKLIIGAVLESVVEFNRSTPVPIKRVGFSPEWTGINRIEPVEAARAIRCVYNTS